LPKVVTRRCLEQDLNPRPTDHKSNALLLHHRVTSAVTSRSITSFNMLCLGVILLVRGRDGMSTQRNGAAAYSQSDVSRIC